MKYKIGDVSKIFGISPDLLRYYEKKGVVHPEKDRDNHYRYYDSWDMNFLADCLWFKAYGFGIEQIAHMMTDTGFDELVDIMAQKQSEIQQTIHMQNLLMGRCQEYLEEVAAGKAALYQCDLQNSPELVLYLNRHNFSYDKSEDIQNMGQRWLKYMPFTHRYFEIAQQALTQGDEDYAWGFSMDMNYVREFQVPVEPPMVHLPAQRSIHSVFKSAGKNNFSPRHVDFMLDYAQENGLAVCGNAHGHLLCSVLEDDVLTGYFEVWIPVKE